MKYCLLIILLLFHAATADDVCARALPRVPSNANLARETIVDVFRMAERCNTIDEIQESVQPLLFLLYRDRGADSSRVLIDLSSYNVGVANTEILSCMLTRRGIADGDFAASLAKGSNDCGSRLGRESVLCLSTEEKSLFLAQVGRAIKNKRTCELEY